MVNLTPLLRPTFAATVKAEDAWRTHAGQQAVQEKVLRHLIAEGKRTEVGEMNGFATVRTYPEFARKTPVVEYTDIRPQVERMLRGSRDVLWPGSCSRFAQSSGTSDGKSKYIPVTVASLHTNHYPGGRAVVAHYLDTHPGSRLFSGKAFILGGSFANEVRNLPRGTRVGDLSAHLIDAISPAVNALRVPDKEIALMADWRRKLPALVKASLVEDITNISGVPSWFLTVLQRVIASAGATTIHDVWPNLEVFFHGGIAFGPYREQYKAITDPGKMNYLETYNASEGFFAVADTTDPGAGMKLLLDSGVFYEFVPLEALGEPHPAALPAWKVEQGKVYALVITSCNGLWRYSIGDTVKIESVEPLRISIAGRTRSFINAFGEEVMVHNTDAALAEACRRTGARALNYTAAPVFAEGGRRGRHQWLIEWAKAPDDLEAFADTLDRALQAVNSDYQAKRSGGIFLDRLEIVTARPGLFDAWLESTGKLGGQRKVPRLANDRHIIDEILKLRACLKTNVNA